MSRVRWYDFTGDDSFHVSRSLNRDAFLPVARPSLWRRFWNWVERRAP